MDNDKYNRVLPLELFLATSVEHPDILEQMYKETEIITTLGQEEFLNLPVNENYNPTRQDYPTPKIYDDNKIELEEVKNIPHDPLVKEGEFPPDPLVKDNLTIELKEGEFPPDPLVKDNLTIELKELNRQLDSVKCIREVPQI